MRIEGGIARGKVGFGLEPFVLTQRQQPHFQRTATTRLWQQFLDREAESGDQ